MAYAYPTIQDFKDYFVRDFPFGTDPNTQVVDFDIQKAFGEAEFNFNGERFSANQTQFSTLFLYLAAHYLVMDLRASSQGVFGQFAWSKTSKSVGSVSEGQAVPQLILDNPSFAIYASTTYGVKYISLIYPQLIGNTFTVWGRSHA